MFVTAPAHMRLPVSALATVKTSQLTGRFVLSKAALESFVKKQNKATLAQGVAAVTFLWLCLLVLGLSSFPLQLVLTLSPAPDLLLPHFQEQGLLLVLVESVQHVGVDVHVLQDLLQHAGGRAGGFKAADTLDQAVGRQAEILSSGPTASCSLRLYRSMLGKISLPPLLFVHTLVACAPGPVHNQLLSPKPGFLSVLRCSSLRCRVALSLEVSVWAACEETQTKRA